MLLILQHHIIASSTRIAAPVIAFRNERQTVLMPRIKVAYRSYRVDLLSVAAVPLRFITEVVDDASVDTDDISMGLDAIFKAYPAGLPN
jgi:hypothetical protein